ncbi:methyl-accepting chemotaxis protein [Aliarcobacter lanthieri]|uniref:methyl-accepting chemotaxis protein n=1 Tax=Aliarcobacter lanthieri TaxID=1355374 RepID=UPI003AAA88FD
MKITKKLYSSFGLIIFLIILLTVIGINRVSIIDNTLKNDVELTSTKQRYAINFRGSVHDRAISIRDVVLSDSKDSSLFKKSIEDIKKLEDFYSTSAQSMDKIFTNKDNSVEEELIILNKIRNVESNTLPLVENIIKLKLEDNNEEALNILLDKASPLFTEWLKVINEFIDYQEANNHTFFSQIREVATGFSTIMIILLFIAIILATIISYLISRYIVKMISKIQVGLQGFFNFLNRETSSITLLAINTKDEFGQMSNLLNHNILKAQKNIDEDRKLIDETIIVLSEFEQGDLCKRLNLNVNNPSLMELKSVLNKMADNLENNINNVLKILEQYANYNYLNKIDSKGLKEHLLKLADGINILGDSITYILSENKSNGLTLDESSNILLENVDKLNISSNEAASSLEETAAALEEITSNIRNNTQNIAKMSNLSTEVTRSSKLGEELANKTTVAMDEINTQVNLVNEAISIIDQIAFQTNILSLNAAVEAATAGEAGLGFSVVAQEVRNLASRSAEAAKEIKDIVENATIKANEGKEIANSMIEGYKELNTNVSQTIDLISDIQNSSKEQLLGIEQINDAVNTLDQQTQQNANIAAQAHDIAIVTDNIAKLIVKDANEKEFIGKNEVKGKNIENQSNNINHTQTLNKKISKSKYKKPEIIKHNNIKNEEWESF